MGRILGVPQFDSWAACAGQGPIGVSAVPFAIDVWISTAAMRKFTQNKGALLPVMGVPLHDVVFQHIFLVPVFSVFVQLLQQLFSIILLFFLFSHQSLTRYEVYRRKK